MRYVMYMNGVFWYIHYVNKVVLARDRYVTGRLGVRREVN